jgi:hypothetical protein
VTPDPTLSGELDSYLGQLGADDQARVVDFARTLINQPNAKQVGVCGKDLLRFAGTSSAEDGEQMIEAIEEGCEQIDASKW